MTTRYYKATEEETLELHRAVSDAAAEKLEGLKDAETVHHKTVFWLEAFREARKAQQREEAALQKLRGATDGVDVGFTSEHSVLSAFLGRVTGENPDEFHPYSHGVLDLAALIRAAKAMDHQWQMKLVLMDDDAIELSSIEADRELIKLAKATADEHDSRWARVKKLNKENT